MDGKFDMHHNFIIDCLEKHFEVVVTKEPDYLFYSVKSKDFLKYNCVRIFFTAENLVPDFNLCDYAIGFHYLDFQDRYIRYPLYLVDGFTAYEKDDYASDLRRAMEKHLQTEHLLEEKSDFCAFVYSNGDAARCREDFFKALSAYREVHSGGKYQNNIGGPVQSKLEFQLKHKFVIAFENTSTSGYTTEKIVHAFSANAIPIYWGNPDIAKEFNPDSFINCHDYGVTAYGDNTEAFQAIIERIRYLDENPEAYMKMIQTPAFCRPSYAEDQKRRFEEFLVNIFCQEKDHAFRRNRYYWGQRYERKQKIGNTVYWALRMVLPLRNWVRNVFTKG